MLGQGLSFCFVLFFSGGPWGVGGGEKHKFAIAPFKPDM